MRFEIELFIGNHSIDDQPNKGLEISNIDEAVKLAEHDLEAVAINKSLVTTHSYLHAKIKFTEEKQTSNPVCCVVAYKPSFQFRIIKSRKEIIDFVDQFQFTK